MSEIRHDGGARSTAALDKYLRALGRAVRDQAVAEAEEVVCGVWAAELARVQHVTELGVASAGAAAQAARILVREQQRVGDLDGLARAQQQLERAQEQQRRSDEAARTLLKVVTEEMQLLALAADEREMVAMANRARLSTARRAVSAAQVGENEPAFDIDLRMDGHDE
ncbi:hypothetical protein KGA66_27770 [Actinocrinis puniceicyclus]|uniref:Uncharacterized protein n=1 Tax=Actinocrinis puniceicyclus TaxID=977794 RepID=A0A8J8BEY2_9ACTN|nr:hypothetical protein [Actinocrinis puniceicyclus]MBS2966863.1 hypothetical protein [Actinocrinis puniceicyclus]